MICIFPINESNQFVMFIEIEVMGSLERRLLCQQNSRVGDSARSFDANSPQTILNDSNRILEQINWCGLTIEIGRCKRWH